MNKRGKYEKMSATSKERSIFDFITGYRTEENAIADYKESRFYCRMVTFVELIICAAILGIKYFIF